MNHPAYPYGLKGLSTARSWAEFLELVREARKELGDPATIWYRGVGRTTYQLLPSLFRHHNGIAKERALFGEYQRTAARLLPKRENDWEHLFDMQHYGIPTRLLDWTDVLGVAIAFALYESSNDHRSSMIYVLNPAKLNSMSGRNGIIRPVNEHDFGYKSIYWENKPFKAIYPVAIDGVLQSERLVAQNGAFTVHGEDHQFFWQSAGDCMRAIELTPDAKVGAREFLEHANLNAFTLFPDIVGMARYLVNKFF